jgi:DNA-binding transcriptional LysR family regulator
VSDHIKALEGELNCRLFDRLSRKIIPTREAEILFIHASEIIERLTHLREAVGSLKKEVAGELIIGASTIPGLSSATGYRRLPDRISLSLLPDHCFRLPRDHGEDAGP